MWDLLQPPDHRGDEILDWILDNDGSVTRTIRITSNVSTPTYPSVGATGQQNHPGD